MCLKWSRINTMLLNELPFVGEDGLKRAHIMVVPEANCISLSGSQMI
jgi:hypothetical protein